MFESLDPHEVALPAEIAELAQACRVLAMQGHEDRTLGHVSLRDPAGRGFWVKRTGVGFAEVATPADFVLLDFEGDVVSGLPFRPKEWPIHAGIYRARPDVNVVGHSHPFFACVMAATEEPIAGITREGSLLRGRVRRFRATTNLVATPALGMELAAALGDGSVVLMLNHGVTFCGATIGECVLVGTMLEIACRAQMLAGVSSYPWSQADSREKRRPADGILDAAEIARRWAYHRRRLATWERRMAAGGGGRRAVPEPVPARMTARDAALAALAVGHRILAMEGHGSTTIGSVALRDPGGEGYWTKMSGIGMDEVLGAAQMLLLDYDGSRIAGGGVPPGNWPLHSAILNARPDVNAVVYSRALYPVVFSATDQPLLPVGDDARHFGYNVPVVTDVTVPVRDHEVARKVAARIGDANGLLIKNVAMVTVGETLTIAVLRALALSRAARSQITAEASGYRWSWHAGEAAGAPRLGLTDPEVQDAFWRYYCRKLDRYEAGRPLPGELRSDLPGD